MSLSHTLGQLTCFQTHLFVEMEQNEEKTEEVVKEDEAATNPLREKRLTDLQNLLEHISLQNDVFITIFVLQHFFLEKQRFVLPFVPKDEAGRIVDFYESWCFVRLKNEFLREALFTFGK